MGWDEWDRSETKNGPSHKEDPGRAGPPVPSVPPVSSASLLRTGRKTPGLLDVHFVSDRDVGHSNGLASKIGADTDPARLIPIGGAQR